MPKDKRKAHMHQPTAWRVPHARAQLGSGTHGQLFRSYWGLSAWHGRRTSVRQSRLPSARHCFKRQLHTTQEGAVGWELHGSSPMACTGKADQDRRPPRIRPHYQGPKIFEAPRTVNRINAVIYPEQKL